MTTLGPFPLAIGAGEAPALIVAAEQFFRDRALAFAMVCDGQVPWNARELVTGRTPTTPAPGKLAGYSQFGVGLVTDGTNSGAAYASPRGALSTTFSAVSAMVIFTPTSTVAGTLNFVLGFGDGSSDPDIGICYDVTNTQFKYLEDAIGSAGAGTSPIGQTYVVVTTKAGTTKKLFVNGVLLSTSGADPTRPGGGHVGIGRQGGGTTSYASGTCTAAAMWSRTFSDAEAIDLSRSLMRTFAKSARFRPQYVATAGSNNNVTPGVGVLTVTGFAPTVAATNNQNVLAGVGVATVTGFAPTVFASNKQTVTPGVGVLTVTGFAPTVAATNNQFIGAGLGQVTLAAFAALVSNGRVVAPGAGVVTLTGFAPEVTVSVNQGVLAGVGTVTLTGFAGVVTATVTAQPSVLFSTAAQVNAKARPALVIPGPPRGP